MRAMVISAHLDDETLGCGGAILKHRAAGREGRIVLGDRFLASLSPMVRKKIVRNTAEIKRASGANGFKEHNILGYSTVV